MIKKLKELLCKNKEIVLYLVFGVGTTVVDFGVSYLLYRKLNIHIVHVIAWVCAVLFAFFTNKHYVFESKTRGVRASSLLLLSFASSRLLTLLLQEAVVWLLYDRLGFSEYVVKLPAAVLVVILNYVISKLFVFRGEKKNER